MTRTETFSIPADRTGLFLKNVRKLNKKAATLRADTKFEATFGDTYIRNVTIGGVEDQTIGVPNKTMKVNFVDVTITGSDFSVGGHTLVAMADFEDPNAPTFSDFNESTFGDYNQITTSCEHCNTNRARRKIFVLQNNESGEFIQVGKSCLKDYLGHSILDAMKGCSFWSDLRDAEDSLYGEYFRGIDFGQSVDHVVAVAIKIIRDNGYVSRAESEEKFKTATADLVRDNIDTKPSDEDKAAAAKIIEWATAEYQFDADDANKNNSFVLNVSNALELGLVPNKMVGIVACLPAMKDRADEKAARDEVNGKSEFFGTVKERITFDAEVVGVHYIDGHYGTTTLYTMLVGTNVAKWFSSRDVLNKGEKYTLKATIKDHDEFNGTKQTVVTRCAIQ